MASFHPAHIFAGVPAHHPLDHHVHPTQVDGGSKSEIHPAARSDSGELEKEAEDDRKAEAAEAAHKTADHAPGLEATLAKKCGREMMDTSYDKGKNLSESPRDLLLR
jgi:hypothetical protein